MMRKKKPYTHTHTHTHISPDTDFANIQQVVDMLRVEREREKKNNE